jgi:inorganic phosphate transporter, PiT family
VTITFVVVIVIIALLFDLVNGFHDAANSIATVVSTKVLRPNRAVLWAAFFNFVAMFIFSPHVADSVAKIVKIQPNEEIYMYVILSGLIGAIVWDLVTWRLGMPTSSSHALIGGIAGAGVICAGWGALEWNIMIKTLLFIVIAPAIGLVLGFSFMLFFLWLLRRQHPFAVDKWFRKGQLLSAALYSIGHGANDAQKTMGIIVALMIAAGILAPETELSLLSLDTLWIILSCQLAMAIGTAIGGWRIVKTMGSKLTKLKPISGFCAETAGACSLFLATSYGIPVSTTHTINGAIIGVGTCSNKFPGVRWNIAQRILWTWIFTIPASGLISALLFWMLT